MHSFWDFIKKYNLTIAIVAIMAFLSIVGYGMSVITLATTENPDVISYVRTNVFAGVALHSMKSGITDDGTIVEFVLNKIHDSLKGDHSIDMVKAEPDTANDFDPTKLHEEYIEHHADTMEKLEEQKVELEQKSQERIEKIKEEAAKEEERAEEEPDEEASEDDKNFADGSLVKFDADNNYFMDSLFIGDSRAVGFCMYSGMPNITAYAQKAFQVYTIDDKDIIATPTGRVTIPQALQMQPSRFKKVYIMFGLNEIGYSEEIFEKYYYELVDIIKQTQPDAIVYMQGVIHVSKAKDADNTAITNERIDERNKRLKEIADEEGVVFLDLNEVFTDKNNCLPDNYSSDGVHLKGQYLSIWADYLKSHAYVRNNWEIPVYDTEYTADTFPTLMNMYIPPE